MKKTGKLDLPSAMTQTDHRPWPMRRDGWTFGQRWFDLLFAHYPIATEKIRHLVPPELSIEEFDGTSWIGVVPFYLTGLMPRWLPDLRSVLGFPELNVRLYVRHGGKSGVWFLSLDAAHHLAVWGAKKFFHLPYHYATMQHCVGADAVSFSATRKTPDGEMRFSATYAPIGQAFEATQGTLEYFLTERYCLFCQSPAGELYRVDVQHVPWSLQPAGATIDARSLLASHGLGCPDVAPHLLFTRGVDVVTWFPLRIS